MKDFLDGLDELRPLRQQAGPHRRALPGGQVRRGVEPVDHVPDAATRGRFQQACAEEAGEPGRRGEQFVVDPAGELVLPTRRDLAGGGGHRPPQLRQLVLLRGVALLPARPRRAAPCRWRAGARWRSR